jgi:hypothetical protein
MPLKDQVSIRLVRITTGEDDTPVNCTLLDVSLKQLPAAYLALSYAWGDGNHKAEITCNSQPLQATENLIAAMRQLRRRYPDRLFWIDAICINQEDTAERAAQVQLMRDIYHSAENVVVYLGEDCEGLDRAMDLFHRMEGEAAKWTGQLDADDQLERASKVRWRFPPSYEEVWYRFHDLFDRPWFSRIWVIQEVVMASGDPDVICGSYTLRWSSVASVAEFFLHTGLSGSTTKQSQSSLVSLMENFKMSPRSLWGMLWLTAPFASSEPRDKVFALYGMVHRLEADMLAGPYFKVDYEKPVKDVYRDLIFGYIMYHGSLDLMSEALEVADEDKSVLGLPSWVPDWSLQAARFSTSKHPSVGRHAFESGYDACAGRRTLVQLSMRDVNADVLRIAGKIHAEVAWVSKPFDGPEYSPLPWQRRPFAMQQLWDEVRERLGSQQQTCQAFWRTLGANADRYGSPAGDHLYTAFLKFWHNEKIYDRDAARYRVENQADPHVTEERERELFKAYATDYETAMTDEEFGAYKPWLELQASQFLPCSSTPECRHCLVLAVPTQHGLRLTGPSPALAMRDTDPFIADFFMALDGEPDFIVCDSDLNILSRMRHTLQNRTFIITTDGLMGLAPKFTRVGDLVAVLSGAKVPFVLRATGRVQSRLEIDVGIRTIRECRVVGDTYVHGIMRGEAVRDVDWAGGGYEVLDLV